MESSGKKGFLHYEINGIPLYLYICMSIPVILGMITGSLGTDMLSTMAMLFVIGMFFTQVGKRLPIWNKWIGGGSMMAIMAPSFMVYMKWLPEKYVESATVFYDGVSFLELYLGLLMVGGLLAVDRDTLLKTLKRCGPVFFGTIVLGGAFGLLGGILAGMAPADILSYYVLPNLGGGNGAGAVPMSEIFEKVTGNSKSEYYATALAILTIGSTIALIMGVFLNRLGDIVPSLTGDKTQLLRKTSADDKVEQKETKKVEVTKTDIAAGFVVAGSFYALACFFGEYLLPSIGKIIIHPYAYLIIFLTLANIFKLIPENLAQGTKALSKFVTGNMGPMCFAGMGIAITDFGEFVGAITLENLFVTFMIIVGITVGAAVLGWMVGFYPIDSAIIVGLCCANRGGSADVVLLGATDRMELMPYAQVLSRLGGAIVLALSSTIFAIMF
ncbi:MAG: 2-hydroxycarboxylate transporter family protein [Lacrimispora sp.]|uniref:2-hydroxycarboxylate transporter family protein n=1 Tax=Lacrimispora sp. TaxID=2719234 RepID=UPI0039E35C2F